MNFFLSQLCGFLLMILLVGCNSNKEMSYDAYLSYIKEEGNGLFQNITEGGFDIETVHRPGWLIAHQNLKDSHNQLELDSLKTAIENFRYFILTISKDGKDLETHFASTGADFQAKTDVLINRFPSTIKYRYQGELKEHAIYDYLYTRSFGVAKSSFLLVFEMEDLNKDVEIIIPGNLIGFDRVIVPFSYKDLNQVPDLKL